MTIKLNILPPSVNNMSARVFLRAADLPFEEENVYGKTREPEYLEKIPSHLTPAVESSDLPRGVLWESCAIMSYLANKHGKEDLYPSDPERRAMIDSANFYHTGSLYPVLARAAYPRLGFGNYAGEVAATDLDDDVKETARKAAEDALPGLLDVYQRFFIQDGGFIGGDKPSIADIRLASTLEFLGVLDGEAPAWVGEYIGRMEKALGESYTGPAGDVRGYIEHVKSQS